MQDTCPDGVELRDGGAVDGVDDGIEEEGEVQNAGFAKMEKVETGQGIIIRN